MSLETTDALVVKSVDFSESSLVSTLFTRDFGKIRGIAKGARRLKNSFETSLDLLAAIRVSFIRKNSDALDLLTEAKLLRRFRPTARNLRGLYAGCRVAELLDVAIADYEPIPDLWDLAESTLRRFQESPDVAKRLAAFEAGLLDALGEFPSTRYCVECGEGLPLDEIRNLDRRIVFAPVEGGVVCVRCRAEKPFFQPFATTIAALKLLESAQALAAGDESAPFESFSPQNRDQLRDLLDRYFCRVLGRRPKTQRYSRFITSDAPENDAAPPPDGENRSEATERPNENVGENAREIE